MSSPSMDLIGRGLTKPFGYTLLSGERGICHIHDLCRMHSNQIVFDCFREVVSSAIDPYPDAHVYDVGSLYQEVFELYCNVNVMSLDDIINDYISECKYVENRIDFPGIDFGDTDWTIVVSFIKLLCEKISTDKYNGFCGLTNLFVTTLSFMHRCSITPLKYMLDDSGQLCLEYRILS